MLEPQLENRKFSFTPACHPTYFGSPVVDDPAVAQPAVDPQPADATAFGRSSIVPDTEAKA